MHGDVMSDPLSGIITNIEIQVMPWTTPAATLPRCIWLNLEIGLLISPRVEVESWKNLDE